MSRILMVDDSRTSRKILRKILEEGGHEVVGEATDGRAGVELYSSLKPDIVTLDITMPVLDGIEALRQIKELDENAKVVMVTSAGQKSKMVEAVRHGAVEFVMKPFQSEQLLSVMEKVVEL